MATAQGQDIICCQLCSNPVEHHCNLCHVDLCLSCVPKHIADKSREHEVVGYTFKKEYTVFLPTCLTHEKKRCEMFCQDCEIQICIHCLMERKQEIVADTEELENIIVPLYRNANLTTSPEEFDKVLSAIDEQEDKFCKAVHEANINLKDKVTKQKKEATKRCKSFSEKAEKELSRIIQNNKNILESNDAIAVINYKSRNGDFRGGPKMPIFPCPLFLAGILEQDRIVDMFGFLQTEDDVKEAGMLKMMNDPVVLSTIQSFYGLWHKLWRVQCVGRDEILISGDNKTINQIDKTGSILNTIHTNDDVIALTINSQLQPVFSLSNLYKKQTDIYIYNGNKVNVLFSTFPWFSVGLYYTRNGYLLVSMRSKDERKSRVVKYSETTEIQKIEYGNQGKPLFSTGSRAVLLLTENGNGDICVADNAGKEVVVVDSSGGLRFTYEGILSDHSNVTEFQPIHIATDINAQILVNDNSNNIIHIIDCDGNFVRYLELSCNGGLSIDVDYNLVIGDTETDE
ncbi:uncharacterized protein LOC134281793 [Saccostrea cucullata]|uniref:uncharacterized protein LOC134281793 n=1 Tax=Saccostrea cuccullata TaxID=36930 RepID=UPI002ED0E979